MHVEPPCFSGGPAQDPLVETTVAIHTRQINWLKYLMPLRGTPAHEIESGAE